MRIGQSTDIHPLVEGRPLILGGVHIPYPKGCLGHSDADALTHVIAEAILGALALGDLGKHYPDTDPRYAIIQRASIDVGVFLQGLRHKVGQEMGNR